MQVYIGIGSNLNAETNITRATELLRQSFGALRCSTLYRTPSIGFDGPDFLNGAICAETAMDIEQVREACRFIESRVGRRRELETECGSRCIDLDLLLFRRGEEDLGQPHPDVYQQVYSALPLSQLIPGWTHDKLQQRPLNQYVKSMNDVERCQLWSSSDSDVSAA